MDGGGRPAGQLLVADHPGELGEMGLAGAAPPQVAGPDALDDDADGGVPPGQLR